MRSGDRASSPRCTSYREILLCAAEYVQGTYRGLRGDKMLSGFKPRPECIFFERAADGVRPGDRDAVRELVGQTLSNL